jgi:hypothetical protein
MLQFVKTIFNSHDLDLRTKNREITDTKRKTKKSDGKRMTQEEIMAEAMKTEEINLSQLVIYQQMEQQRKNKFRRKVTILLRTNFLRKNKSMENILQSELASLTQGKFFGSFLKYGFFSIHKD